MLFDLDELVLARAQADLLGMRDARAPVGVGMRDAEGILGLLALQMLVIMLHLGRAVGKLGVRQRLQLLAFVIEAATGQTLSDYANMPISLTIGVSFSGWQSQLGLISMASEMWKLGRPSTTALVYSAIL